MTHHSPSALCDAHSFAVLGCVGRLARMSPAWFATFCAPLSHRLPSSTNCTSAESSEMTSAAVQDKHVVEDKESCVIGVITPWPRVCSSFWESSANGG